MKGAFRVFLADLLAMVASYRAIALVLLLPSVLLLLVGQLRSRTEVYALHVAGEAAADAPTARKRLDEAVRLWQQVSTLSVTRDAHPIADPLRAIREQRLDLLLNVGDAGTSCWRLYTAETRPHRAAVLQDLAAGLERSLLLIATRQNRASDAFCPQSDPAPPPPAGSGAAVPANPEGAPDRKETPVNKAPAPPPPSPPPAGSGTAVPANPEGVTDNKGTPVNEELEDLSASLVGLGVLPPATLFDYHPGAFDRRQALFPMTIALVVCLLPFVIAAPGLIRDKDGHTLEVLLSAPAIDGPALFAGKCVLPLALTLFNLLLMLVVVDAGFGLHVKSGMATTILLILPALLSSTLLGLMVSTLVTSQTQALMASAVYFFCLTLLTGFVTPLAEASPLVQTMSRLLPLSFLLPMLEGWLFGAEASRYLPNVGYLTLQAAVFGGIAAVLFLRFLRRL